jgi:hypothetical protein
LVEIEEDIVVVGIGTKLIVRYLDGPRAGMKNKYFLSDSKSQSVDDVEFQPLPFRSPLGQVVQGEPEGTIVSFEQAHGSVLVKIEEIVQQGA